MKKKILSVLAVVLALVFAFGTASCTMRDEAAATNSVAADTVLPSGEITEIPATPAPTTETAVEGSRIIELTLPQNVSSENPSYIDGENGEATKREALREQVHENPLRPQSHVEFPAR